MDVKEFGKELFKFEKKLREIKTIIDKKNIFYTKDIKRNGEIGFGIYKNGKPLGWFEIWFENWAKNGDIFIFLAEDNNNPLFNKFNNPKANEFKFPDVVYKYISLDNDMFGKSDEEKFVNDFIKNVLNKC